MIGQAIRGTPSADRLLTLSRVVGAREVTATVDTDGGGLHGLTVAGVPLVHSYDPTRRTPFCAGSVLFPWPNRVRDGHWRQGDTWHLLPINDPLGNANHGFAIDSPFAIDWQTGSAAALSFAVAPRVGYPFAVGIQVTYRLTDDGVCVDLVIRNDSATPAPVAVGAHPYLRIGDVPVRDLVLRVQADHYLMVDDQLIPVAEAPVAGTGLDLRDGRALGDLDLNVCYTGLGGDGGFLRHSITAPDGRSVELWTDEAFGHLQVYTCPAFPTTSGTVRAVAVEPMTAAPDALNSGRGLTWLAPSSTWESSWGLRGHRIG